MGDVLSLRLEIGEITRVGEARPLLEALVRNGGRISQTLREFGWTYKEWVTWRRRVPSDLGLEIEEALQFGKLKKREDCDETLHRVAVGDAGECSEPVTTDERIKAAGMLLKLETPTMVISGRMGDGESATIAERLFGSPAPAVEDEVDPFVTVEGEVVRSEMMEDPFGPDDVEDA